jgi:hypothetical protein
VPLLKLLTDETKDDLSRHRLALSAHCLPEVQAISDHKSSAIVDRITTVTFSCWLEHEINSVRVVTPLTRALPALGQANGRIVASTLGGQLGEVIKGYLKNEPRGLTLLDLVGKLLRDQKRYETATLRAVGGLGAAAATPEILASLVELVHYKRWPEMLHMTLSKEFEVEMAVRSLGAAAATPEFLASLAELLCNDDGDVRTAAARAVGGLGAAAATPYFLGRRASVARSRGWWYLEKPPLP